ncbi:MAG: hypothetical protein H6737_00080 [Alphaproteobacteria bacterium]|nr:hypothetical protein [Alphaproteobacteria bacterium]
MLLLALNAAHASAMSTCGAALLPDGPGTRVLVSCEGASSAPGGPVSHFDVPVPNAPLSLRLRNVEVAVLERVETREDGTAVYATDRVLEPGLPYFVEGPDPIGGGGVLTAGPDTSVVHRCFTNPDTCVAAAEVVPAALGPALRMRACLGRHSCDEARKDPLSDDDRGWLEVACTAFNPLACDWMQELEPATPWQWVDATPPGRGKLQSIGIRFFTVPADTPMRVGWTDEVPSLPVLSADLDDTVQPASSRNGRAARWNADGIELHDGKRRVWEWPIAGVEGAALRPDGQQLLLRSGRLIAWVAFDTQQIAPFQGVPAGPHGVPASGTLIRADGWPAAGTRVSAPCDADDTAFSCTALTDLLGRWYLAGMHGSTVRVEGPHVGAPRELVAVKEFPVRIPDTDRVFDFEVDDDGRVVRATEPVKVGDVVVSLGPLPVDREPVPGSVWLPPVPHEAWAGLATSWGSVEVVRGKKRVVLR